MDKFIFLKPELKEMIWGGDRLKKFGYELQSARTGEAWLISAHDGGSSICISGRAEGQSLKGLSLREIWENYPEIFGLKSTEGKTFPLLIKYIDAKDNLSIQVHPDDEYARVNENGSKGKTECWYILDCDEDADIVIGHKAHSRLALKEMVAQGRWDELLDIRPIKKGDFFYIEAGTVHAIRKGTLILEVQQNSDITYRLYDYDRLDKGVPRQLHIDKSIDVIKIPAGLRDTKKPRISLPSGYMDILADEEFFTVEHMEIDGTQRINLDNDRFYMVNALKGNAVINGEAVKIGDNFIIPSEVKELHIEGNIEMIVSAGK